MGKEVCHKLLNPWRLRALLIVTTHLWRFIIEGSGFWINHEL